MKYGMYVIFDKVASEAGFPFDAKNDDIAKRRFEDIINRQIRPVKTVSVDDYELRFIGEFDSENCAIDNLAYPNGRTVCCGSDVNMWPQEEIDKLSRPTPIFDMEVLKKLLVKDTPFTGVGPQLNPGKNKFKWWKK